jgi:AcrR family transcriptional regulator
MAVISKRKRASQKKKERIIQTTMQLLLKKGSSSSTSTTDICRGAHLTRPTLYNYFGSKRNLMLSVHMESIEKTLRPYLEEAASIEEPLQRLTYMINTYAKEIVCLHPELRVLIHDTLTFKDKYFRQVREVWKRHYLLLKDTIAALRSDGRIDKSIKPSWAALFILGMLTWVTYWLDYGRKDHYDEIGDLALRLIFRGLGIEGQPPVGSTPEN